MLPLGNKKIRVSYDFSSIRFIQVNRLEDTQNGSINVLGSGLRLEPATIDDTGLAAGAYIVDTGFRPIIAFDSEGYIRYLDESVSWSVRSEQGKTIYTASRG